MRADEWFPFIMTSRILRKRSPGRGLLRVCIRRQVYHFFMHCLIFLSPPTPSGVCQGFPKRMIVFSLYFIFLQIISNLLRPRNWKAPGNRRFFLDSYEVGELCYAAEQIFMHEPTVLQLKAPVKVFGDLHGQFGDLMRLFDEYGFPSSAGDIT